MLNDQINWEFRQLTQPTAGVPMTKMNASRLENSVGMQAESQKSTPTHIHWKSFFAGAYCAFILQAIVTLYLRT
jgi:hypothetical protein